MNVISPFAWTWFSLNSPPYFSWFRVKNELILSWFHAKLIKLWELGVNWISQFRTEVKSDSVKSFWEWIIVIVNFHTNFPWFYVKSRKIWLIFHEKYEKLSFTDFTVSANGEITLMQNSRKTLIVHIVPCWWTFLDFSVIQILREIDFWGSRILKMPFWHFLGLLILLL